ncbi:hypothetical protein D0S48_00255 [Psychrobacillus sp. AK 1817]|uniref:PilN domain-containing protein n=1 Tax=Psychrobacillus sp. AK 1817 TaxID=2303505 RepID=UPI001247B118|nr:hypothetical protein [Psychrobacillus sp. AK 1817]QEY19253.1 hypothetical protein D0S48_00255 [Psychrobacillus sp. AK 1817]
MVPEINLLPPIERRKSSNLLVIIGAILVGLLLIFLCIQYFSLKSDLKSLSSKETEISVERDLLSSEVDVMQTGNQGSLSSSVTFVESVSYPVSPLIDEIQSLLVVNTYLRNYEFNEEGVLLKADFETITEISAFIEKLLNSPYFHDVKVEKLSSFEPLGEQDTESETIDFDAQWRNSVILYLEIENVYLREGGPQK